MRTRHDWSEMKRPRISRRVFLAGLGGLGAGTVAAGAGAWWIFQEYPPAMLFEKVGQKIAAYRYPHLGLAKAIQRHFSYLNIADEEAVKFATKYEEVYQPKTAKASLEKVYQVFLLSTDFFQNGADQSRPLRFTVLYHPHKNPCYNPLAILDERA